MLGGDHLLGVSGVLAAAEAFDFGDAARGHDDAAPAAAGELEHGPDQAQGAGLAGEAAITLVRRRTSTKVRSSRFVDRIRLRCSVGQRRCATRASRLSVMMAIADG